MACSRNHGPLGSQDDRAFLDDAIADYDQRFRTASAPTPPDLATESLCEVPTSVSRSCDRRRHVPHRVELKKSLNAAMGR